MHQEVAQHPALGEPASHLGEPLDVTGAGVDRLHLRTFEVHGDLPLDRADEQVGLVLEVGVDRRERHRSGADDVADRGLDVSLLGEQLRCGLDERGTCGLRPPRCGPGSVGGCEHGCILG